MPSVVNEKYELSYDDDFVVLVDKKNNELIVRIFNDEIKELSIDASKTKFSMSVESFNLTAKNEIHIQSELAKKGIPCIFLNSDEEVNESK